MKLKLKPDISNTHSAAPTHQPQAAKTKRRNKKGLLLRGITSQVAASYQLRSHIHDAVTSHV